MSKFEILLNETSTLTEALALQPCLEDNLTEYEVEKIRANFLEEWYNLSIFEYFFIKKARDRKKAVGFERALRNNAPARLVSYATR